MQKSKMLKMKIHLQTLPAVSPTQNKSAQLFLKKLFWKHVSLTGILKDLQVVKDHE